MKTSFARFCLVTLLCAGAVLAAVAPMVARASDDVAECGRLYEAEKYEEAFPVCKRAAEAGDAEGQFNLGRIYDHGNGVVQDYKEAVKWYRLAAEQGDARAQNNLGWMYDNGEGVGQDKREAVKWYRLAAEQGDARAQNNLGWMYDNGQGVITDPIEAFIWYSIAAVNGNEMAENNRLSLEWQLNSGEIRAARAEAKRRLAAIDAGTYGEKSESESSASPSVSAPPSVATASKDEKATPAQRAFENVWRSVVTIETGDGQGSGVIVSPHIVATNCHVIEDASVIHVYEAVDQKADKTTAFAATTRKRAFDKDVCLLDVQGLFGVPAQFRNADSLSVGENVYAVGAPQGLDLSLSTGVVSQLRREDEDNAPTIQTDAAISPGSSGGALADGSGYVVGITTEKYVDEDVEGIAFAVPIEWVLEMLE